MAAFLKPAGLTFALLALIAVLIIIPAAQLGVAGNWRVVFLSISYFVFFLGTVWRVVRYGQLASRQEDRQVQATSGHVASLITVVGLLSSYILLFLGFCLMLQSLWGSGLLLVICVVWFGSRIGIEEQMLEERFGEEYQSYCQQTKRLFPYVY